MPVGTYGAVKTLAPWEVQQLGAQIILSNTFHLYLRPGLELLSEFGGVHRFMGWSGPILTDSGGFQVFSLGSLAQVDDKGVSFKSPIDGGGHYLTPERVVDIQRLLGSDIMMALDDCPAGDIPLDQRQERWEAAVHRTTIWAGRCLQRYRETKPGGEHAPYLMMVVQGGTDPALRQRSVEQLLELGEEPIGYAVGGLAVGEPKEALFATLELMDRWLPADKPRYLMGVGTPADLVRAVAAGMDMFDCVLPTRNARNGQLFTPNGPLNIRNARHRTDLDPVDPNCACPLCNNFSRAHLAHLFRIGEMLALRLATAHNLRFYHNTMEQLRGAIESAEFSAWSRKFLQAYENGAS